jgi:peptide/nickel transport system permease protein
MNLWLQNALIAAAVVVVAVLARKMVASERNARAWQRLRKDLPAMLALAVVLLYLFVGILGSLAIPDGSRSGGRITILDYLFRNTYPEPGYSAPLANTTFGTHKPEPLKGIHFLGTDQLGKDVFHETLKGCRTALIIGGLTSAIYIPVGMILGILAGFYRKRVDDAVQYLFSTVAAVPSILLLIAILIVLGRGLDRMALALSITSWVGLCRLVRGETLRQATRPYIEAARVSGQGNWKIITRHIVPNVMHLVVISFVLGFSGLVLTEAVLSYLGVGAPVGTASWGAMIDAGRMELSREPAVWWNLVAATGAIFFFVLSLNLLGDALRRAFDPRSA